MLSPIRLLTCLLAASCAFLCAGCGGTEARDAEPISPDRPLRIVTTIRPLELIVRDLVAGSDYADRIIVTAVMPADVSPHGFEPTPAQVARLRRADIIVYNGFGLDDWAARDTPKGTRLIRFADVADLEHDHHHHDHDHDHHECDHGPIDEHFWLDPALVNALAVTLAVEIARAVGGDDEAMTSMNAAMSRFLGEVRTVAQEFENALAPHAGKRIITHHNVFSRIAQRHHLADPVVLRPLAALEPSPADLRRAIDTIREDDIRAILAEPQFSADAARQIERETGVRLVTIDPLGGEAESWAALMRSVLAAMLESFSNG